MPNRAPDIVLRFSGVTISRDAFEVALGCPLHRYERSRAGDAHFAQVNVPEGSSWEALVDLIERLGPGIERCLKSGEIERPLIDAALYLPDDKASSSLVIPFAVVAASGKWGFEIEVSGYATATD